MIFKVPVALLPVYPDQDVIIRGSDSGILVRAVLEDHAGRIKGVQLLSPDRGVEELAVLPPTVAIDLCLSERHQHERNFSAWSELFANRGIRLVVPVRTGFSSVTKEALRAGLRVILDLEQPDEALVEELADTFAFFAREPEVKAPIDLFAGLLRSFFTGQVQSLWHIQEEDPASHRYVSDEGEVRLSRRSAQAETGSDPAGFLADHKLALFLRKEECCTCRFFNHCRGYFKVPGEGYSCSAVKQLFELVWGCAAELKKDLSQAPGATPAHA